MTIDTHHKTAGGRAEQDNNHLPALFSRSLLEILPHKVFYKDSNLSYVCCNSLYAADLKITPAEIAGTTDYDYYPTALAEKYRADDKKVMETGASIFIEEEYLYEGQPQWVATVKGPVRDEHDVTIGVIGIFWDITAKKQDEKVLLESEERFRAAFEQAAVGMAFVALDGKWLSFNQKLCDIVGYSKAELLGLTFQDITHPDDLDIDLGLVRQVLDDAIKTYTLEKRYLRKDHSVVWINLTVSLVRWPSGEPKYFISVIEDISRRKGAEDVLRQTYNEMENLVKMRTAELQKNQQALVNVLEDLNIGKKELEAANERLKEMDRLKSVFIASMSHELRTPLNSVIGFSKVLANEWPGPVNDEQKKLLLTISRSGKHLLTLINDVIDISKIESGKLATYIEDFDLQEVICEAVDSIKKEITDKGLELKVETLTLAMHSDRRCLLQCLLNLLSNAMKFTLTGSIDLAMKIDGDWVSISVADTGIGIKEEDMPRLFGSFERLDLPLRSSVPGTGLGLYLTRKLARESLGGDVSAESTHGVGSRFSFRIPVILNNQQKGVTGA